MLILKYLCSPQLCVGLLFLILYPGSPPPRLLLPPPPHTTLSHTIFHTQLCQPPSVTHHLSHTASVTHHLSHTALSATIFHHLSHTTLSTTICHTHRFSHTASVTHHLSHTTLSATIFHRLSHTTLSTTIFHIQLCHTPSVTHHLSHTPSVTHHFSHTTLSTPSFTYNFVNHHLSPSFTHNFVNHHRSFCVAGVTLMALSGALGPAWSRVTPRNFCVAGVALGDIHLHFTWQAWHLVISTLISHPRSFCVAGVTLMALSGALGPAWSRVTPRNFCVAGVALGDIHLHFTWQAWHLVTSTLISRGRRGTISHPRSFCVAGVAGVALMALSGALGPAWSRVTPRHFCVAGVALISFTWNSQKYTISQNICCLITFPLPFPLLKLFFFCGISMGFLWDAYGISEGVLWEFYGICMMFL